MRANYQTAKSRRYTVYEKLPEEQRLVVAEVANEIAEKRFSEIEKEVRNEAIGIGVDIALQTVLLTLIDDFGWGTTERQDKPSRIRRLVKTVLSRMENEAERYDDAYLYALQYQLRERGVDYEVTPTRKKEENEAKEKEEK